MDSPVDEIKQKIEIIDFIGSFITLRKSGRNFKALCPFHQEKTPSFVVSPERQIWHCFGACQEGGDIFKFLMKWENITFFEALRELAEKAGVKLKKISFEDKTWQKKERLISMNILTEEYFQYLLFKTDYGKKAREYLTSRLINNSTAKKFQLGYAPQSWDSLLKFLKKKKFIEEELLEGGLVVKGERGSLYDRFRGRLIFPIKDVRGNIIGFSGRALEDQDNSAKYINTPETPIYHKKETLFGIDLAREAIKKEKNAILVEGEFDVISPYQSGFEHFVAIKGSAVTKEQLMLLKRYTNRITLALDADAAGEEAVKRGIEEAENLDLEIGIVSFNFAKDPDEAVNKDINRFKKIIKKPVPMYDFIIDISQKKYPEDDSFSKKMFADDVVPYIERIRNPIAQSYYVKKIARLLNVSENSVEILIKRIKQKSKSKQVFKLSQKKSNEGIRELTVQKYLLSLIFQSKNPHKIADKIFKIISPEDFFIPAFQKITKIFINNQAKSTTEFSAKKFINQLDKELQPVFDELYLFASSDADLILNEVRDSESKVQQAFDEQKIERLVYEIKKLSLKRKITNLLCSGNSIYTESEQELKKFNRELKEVEKKLVAL